MPEFEWIAVWPKPAGFRHCCDVREFSRYSERLMRVTSEGDGLAPFFVPPPGDRIVQRHDRIDL